MPPKSSKKSAAKTPRKVKTIAASDDEDIPTPAASPFVLGDVAAACAALMQTWRLIHPQSTGSRAMPATTIKAMEKVDPNWKCGALKCAIDFLTQFGSFHDDDTITMRTPILSLLKHPNVEEAPVLNAEYQPAENSKPGDVKILHSMRQALRGIVTSALPLTPEQKQKLVSICHVLLPIYHAVAAPEREVLEKKKKGRADESEENIAKVFTSSKCDDANKVLANTYGQLLLALAKLVGLEVKSSFSVTYPPKNSKTSIPNEIGLYIVDIQWPAAATVAKQPSLLSPAQKAQQQDIQAQIMQLSVAEQPEPPVAKQTIPLSAETEAEASAGEEEEAKSKKAKTSKKKEVKAPASPQPAAPAMPAPRAKDKKKHHPCGCLPHERCYKTEFSLVTRFHQLQVAAETKGETRTIRLRLGQIDTHDGDGLMEPGRPSELLRCHLCVQKPVAVVADQPGAMLLHLVQHHRDAIGQGHDCQVMHLEATCRLCKTPKYKKSFYPLSPVLSAQEDQDFQAHSCDPSLVCTHCRKREMLNLDRTEANALDHFNMHDGMLMPEKKMFVPMCVWFRMLAVMMWPKALGTSVLWDKAMQMYVSGELNAEVERMDERTAKATGTMEHAIQAEFFTLVASKVGIPCDQKYNARKHCDLHRLLPSEVAAATAASLAKVAALAAGGGGGNLTDNDCASQISIYAAAPSESVQKKPNHPSVFCIHRDFSVDPECPAGKDPGCHRCCICFKSLVHYLAYSMPLCRSQIHGFVAFVASEHSGQSRKPQKAPVLMREFASRLFSLQWVNLFLPGVEQKKCNITASQLLLGTATIPSSICTRPTYDLFKRLSLYRVATSLLASLRSAPLRHFVCVCVRER